MQPIKLDPSLEKSVAAQKNLAQKQLDRLYTHGFYTITYMGYLLDFSIFNVYVGIKGLIVIDYVSSFDEQTTLSTLKS